MVVIFLMQCFVCMVWAYHSELFFNLTGYGISSGQTAHLNLFLNHDKMTGRGHKLYLYPFFLKDLNL